MIDWLDRLDKSFFQALNSLHAGWLDQVWWFLSSRWFWVAAGIPLGAALYRQRGLGGLLRPLGALALALLLADQLSASVLKPWVARPRPCHAEAGLVFEVHRYGGCGGPYGFVSSHAANAAAAALVLSAALGRRWRAGLWAGALLLGWSRVGLGVHYPGDVLAGGLLGAACGWLSWRLSGAAEERLQRP
jgi:undecaprenyl-diphosphatase